MNIKRRLFISNILMILIPLVSSILVFQAGMYVFTSVTGIRERFDPNKRREFAHAVRDMRAMTESWGDGVTAREMTRDVDAFNEKRGGRRIFLQLYHNGVPASENGRRERNPVIEAALKGDTPAMFLGGTTAHVESVGDYRLILTDTHFFAKEAFGYREVMWMGTAVSLICAVFVVFFTNRFLTQFVFRRILYAMDTLTYGVHQIRDGNLDYRIHYAENDEFTTVCNDFNTMAAHLRESVDARYRDELSRKELIAGISHDLRTPLTSIKAYVEGIEQGIAATPEARKRYLDTIRDKALDLEHIIDMLFLFSKLDTGEFPYRMEIVDAAELVSEVADGLREEYAARGLDISLGDIAHAFVNVDPMQIRRVMLNVFENSAKYREAPRGAMRISVSAADGVVSISMTDDGPGVPDAALDKLFDVFYRSDPARNRPARGSGMGLAIAAKIVGHFGGTIHARAAVPHGLSVVMTLPRQEVDLSEREKTDPDHRG